MAEVENSVGEDALRSTEIVGEDSSSRTGDPREEICAETASMLESSVKIENPDPRAMLDGKIVNAGEVIKSSSEAAVLEQDYRGSDIMSGDADAPPFEKPILSASHEPIAVPVDDASKAADDDPPVIGSRSLGLKERLKQGILKKRALVVEPTPYVRIDHFQRPLNVRAMLQWLSELLGIEVKEDRAWVNSIKTHCYVDFDSSEEARICIEKVVGLHYPSTSTAKLAANFTSVSAKEAPGHPEAAAKPGEWKSVTTSKAVDGAASGDVVIVPSSAASNKRKLAEAGSSSSAAVDQGSSLLKRAIQASAAAVESEPKKRRTDAAKSRQSELKLEDLFRKTSSQPPLYWLPISDEVVQERKATKLSAGSSTA